MTAPDPVATAPKKVTGASNLTQKVHGVPVWGWIVVGVAVVGVMLYLHVANQKKKVSAASSNEIQQGGGYSTVGYMPQTTTAENVRILTNQDWSTAAQKWLVQQGHDAGEAADAVQNYLANEKLTAGQQRLISLALKAIGPLPEGRGGAAPKMSRLSTPRDGNIIGQMLYGLADVLGMDDPDNKIAAMFLPFFNNIIDQGPISGVFQGANDALGGNVGLNLSPTVGIPGIGTIGGNLGISNQQVGGGISLPGIPIQTPFGPITLGGGGSGSVSPNTRDVYLGRYVVQQGDTLASISKKMYGGTGGAALIYRANLGKIPNPSRLTPGTTLDIPAVGSNG